jgi:hypothetical protein
MQTSDGKVFCLKKEENSDTFYNVDEVWMDDDIL